MGKTQRVGVFESHDVYCARPSRWGNPFVIGKDGTRSECLKKYRQWLPAQLELMDDLPDLKGLRLACYCGKSESCHVDTLIDFIEASENKAKIASLFEDENGI